MPFEVERVSFAYEDTPSAAKRRPVIVARVSEDAALVLVVKVTGHGPRLGYPGEVRLMDRGQAGLSKPSVARCSQMASVPLAAIQDASVYGQLFQRDEEAVVRGLHEAGMA